MTQQQTDQIASLNDNIDVLQKQIAFLEANFKKQKNQLDRQITATQSQIESIQKATPDFTKLTAGA